MLKNYKNYAIFLLVIIFSSGFSLGLLDNNILNNQESSSIIEFDSNGLEDVIDLSSNKIDNLLRQEASNFLNKKIPLIILTDGKLSSSEKNELVSLGGKLKYEYSIIKGVSLSIDTNKLDDIAKLNFINKIEFDGDTKIFLAQSTTQIGASRVWVEFDNEGENVKIAILDTGIDNNHQDLKNVVLEQDFTGEGSDDKNGHGTHVASIAAGSGASSGGLNKGVASKASLFDIKVLDSSGSGKLSDTIAGIEFSVLNDADIISMSLGSTIPCSGVDATSLAANAAVRRGVHVIAAAGNLGPLPGTITSPGCASDIVTVGAVDRLDNVAAFSSRGPALNGENKPDVVAPGVLILAASNSGGYTAKSGTSMATPFVSGVVALILSEKPGLSPEQIKDVLKITAKDIGEDKNTQGSGRIDAYNAFMEATGLEPSEENKEKEEAKKKARDEENVDNVRKVRDKKENDKEYYVVDGDRTNEKGEEERVWVFVNKDTGEIDKVEIINFLKSLYYDILDFFGEIFSFINFS